MACMRVVSRANRMVVSKLNNKSTEPNKSPMANDVRKAMYTGTMRPRKPARNRTDSATPVEYAKSLRNQYPILAHCAEQLRASVPARQHTDSSIQTNKKNAQRVLRNGEAALRETKQCAREHGTQESRRRRSRISSA